MTSLESPRVSSYQQPQIKDQEQEDENLSEKSTLKFKRAYSIQRSSGSRTFWYKSFKKIKLFPFNFFNFPNSYINPYVNSETLINDDFDSLSDDEFTLNPKPPSFTRISRINADPEAEKKRKEAYDNWLKAVNARERERKRRQKERQEAEKTKKLENHEVMKAERDEKIKLWMEKKETEAKEKLTRLNELKKRSSDINLKKPKDFKRAIDFKQWIEIKNDEYKAQKRSLEEKQHLQRDYQKCRESTSAVVYSKWKETSKGTPKPVPFNRGLDSLRGSTTKIFVNPIAWKTLDE